jgi:hypothetical protein
MHENCRLFLPLLLSSSGSEPRSLVNRTFGVRHAGQVLSGDVRVTRLHPSGVKGMLTAVIGMGMPAFTQGTTCMLPCLTPRIAIRVCEKSCIASERLQ